MEYEKRKHFIVNLLYFVIIIALVTILIRYGFHLVAPFLLAFVFSYIIKSLAKWITNRIKLPYKIVSLLLVIIFYGTIGVLISLIGVKLVTTSIGIFSNVPTMYSKEIEPAMVGIFQEFEHFLYRIDPSLVNVLNDVFSQFVHSLGNIVSGASVKIVGVLSGYASSLPGLFVKILLMIISTFFITADYDLLMGFVTRQMSDKVRSLVFQIKEYVVGTLFVCIRSYAMIMTITFIELSIGLSIIRVPNAILIALCIAIFDILPVLGTGGIMIPWAILSLLQGHFLLGIELLVIYLIVTIIRNIIEPKIVGSQIGLHPVVTLISMFVGAQLFGGIGLFGLPIFLSLLCHLNKNGTIKIFK